MAELIYRTKEIYVPLGKGLTKYPFSFVELVDPATDLVVGSGMMPDGDNVLRSNWPSDTSGDGQVIGRMVNPDFVLRKELASGVLESEANY